MNIHMTLLVINSLNITFSVFLYLNEVQQQETPREFVIGIKKICRQPVAISIMVTIYLTSQVQPFTLWSSNTSMWYILFLLDMIIFIYIIHI